MTLKKLGRYDLLRVLGQGAMGVVYEGRDPNLDRRVAIKTVRVENLSEAAASEYEARFRTEARSAARLQHPNIVSVYDSDRDGGTAFLVMEFVQGDDLKNHLDKGVCYSLEQSLKMIRDLLSALDYAHKQSIIHRDVKPANLIIEPGGRVKLTDFGVARIQDSGESTRTQGSMVGTLKYMSPEQVQGLSIDNRADLFSVGVVLYQLLTNRRPFDGDNDFSIIQQIIGQNPPPPSTFNARLPPNIDAVMSRALAKDRDQRFSTARDFAVALQAATRRAGDTTQVIPPASPPKPAVVATAGGASRGTGGEGSSQLGAANPAHVAQELELVYWKDIKDSEDIQDFEDFLAKFPDGIYAALAQRRLKKLASGADLSTLTLPPTSRPADLEKSADADATRMKADGSKPTRTLPLLDLSPEQAGENLPAPDPADEKEPTRTQPLSTSSVLMESSVSPLRSSLTPDEQFAETRFLADTDTPESLGSSAAAHGNDAAVEPVQARKGRSRSSKRHAASENLVPPQQARKSAKPVWLGLAGLVLISVLAWWVWRPKPVVPVETVAMADPASSAASSPASIASDGALPVVQAAAPNASSPAVSAPAEQPVAPPVASASAAAVPGSLTLSAPVPSSTMAALPVAPASAPLRPARTAASGPRQKASAASQSGSISTPSLPQTDPTPAPSPVVVPPPTRPVASPSVLQSPRAACESKVFISFQLCMNEQCALPRFQRHPVCVERQEMEKIRRDRDLTGN